ncbi:smooth muscle caldesmon [Staphylococcus sp. SB1-57]|uniref:smooth muscle caldesmon n=1 Tax=unclassified Staphylococcus TaxID=91994 RepID=UPI000EBC9623|nr:MULTISPECIES: smooth muscle caldesmon [unclassified Staphylococcus]QSF52537.1 smooth muscle caldesmon [Staphylococcus sp. SB1-57]HBY83077.1 smooth muscle caldesmon [Staphylococcus sp.]
MEHYNRDDFERNNTGNDLYSRHTRINDQTPQRKDFVVSFITGAIVGSALGLYYKMKVFEKADQAIAKEKELREKALNYKSQAEHHIETVKTRVENFRNKSNNGVTSDELSAKKVAIQREVSDHNLADQSPEAREIQEAKLEADNHSKVGASATELAAQQNAIKSETNHDQLADQSPQAREIQDAKVEAKRNDQQTATPSSKELAAQQNAIQAESNHDQLADQSPQAREIQEAKADAKSKQADSNIDNNKHVSDKEIAMAQSAIKEESSLSDPSQTKDKAAQTSSADKLASAAHTKKQKMNNDSQVLADTSDLTKEQDVAKSNKQTTPNLLNQSNHNASKANDGSFANRLATAAKDKQAKLTKGSKESQLTNALLAEAPIAKSKMTKVPNLVTKSSTNETKGNNVSQTTNQQPSKKQNKAQFDKGVVTRQNNQSTKSNNKTKTQTKSSKQSTKTPSQNKNQKQQGKKQQKVEKTTSKIEKRTFND